MKSQLYGRVSWLSFAVLFCVMLGLLTAGPEFSFLDPFCEEKAEKTLQRIEKAVLPDLDKTQIALVSRIDQCDSGGGPYLLVNFHPGVGAEAVRGRLSSSPWVRLEGRSLAAYYKDDPTFTGGELVYSKKLGSDKFSLEITSRGARSPVTQVGVEIVSAD